MQEPIVKIKNLSHRYSKDWAVKDVSFELNKSGVLGLLGSNGAGKSTTMNILCGALNQTQGDAFINGINIRTHATEAKKLIGFLPQKAPLYFDLTVDEYLTHCAHLRKLSQEETPAALQQAKEKCGIAHFSDRLLRNLSGGYQQRVGIAQAIIHNPPLVVLDEPTNGLDPVQIIEVRNLIKEIGKDKAVILSTHILSEVQATCDHIKMIEKGKLVFSGTMDDFNNYIEPNTLIIIMEDTPSKETLMEISGVLGVNHIRDNKYRIHFDPAVDITGTLVKMSVKNNWNLREIYLEKSSLDDVFAKLAQN